MNTEHARQTIGKDLNKYNSLISLLIDDLREMLDGPLRDDERRWVLTVMDKVLDYLQIQFNLEESSGYLDDVLDQFPNWYPQLRHLQQEHHLLHDQLKDIRDRLEATAADSQMTTPFRRHLTDWMISFQLHQEREEKLLQEAFILDIGQGE